jgi:hypothetical protein
MFFPEEDEVAGWDSLTIEELYQEDAIQSFSSFVTSAEPKLIFTALWEYLARKQVEPTVDETNWVMRFKLPEETFGDIEFEPEENPETEAVAVPPVEVQARIRQLIDADAEVDESECLREKKRYIMDFMCTGGNRFTFADFFRAVRDACLINFHILD